MAHAKRTNAGRRRVDPWVGPWLRGRREADQIAREKIAAALDRDLSSVSKLETGRSSIIADDLPVVLRAYGATMDDFAAAAKQRKSHRVAA